MHKYRLRRVLYHLTRGRLLRLYKLLFNYVTEPYLGVPVTYDPTADIGSQLFLQGQFEAGEVKLCRGYIPQDAVIFDIGANIGLHTIFFAQLAPQGMVFSLEPAPETFQLLLKNIAPLNNVIPLNIACSDGNGLADFFVAADDGYSGLKDTRRKPIKARRRVVCSSLDSLFSMLALQRADFVKIDVEGAEENVLRGMSKIIDTCRPVIFCEIYQGAASNSSPERTVEYLLAKGYEAYVINQGQLMAYRGHRDDLYNYLFLPKSAGARTQ